MNINKKIKIRKPKKNLENFKYDLIKMNKISFIEIDEYQKNKYKNKFLYRIDGYDSYYTINGLNKLTLEEKEHFTNFIYDYFYYGYPNYKDSDDEMSDCEIAIENGCVYIEEL